MSQLKAGWYGIRVNQPGYGPKIISWAASNLDPIAPAVFSDLSQQPCNFIINGPPSGASLPAGNYTASNPLTGYVIADLAFDTVGQNAYICSKAGSNATSVWQPLGQGGSGIKAFMINPAAQSGPNAVFTGTTIQAADGTTIYKSAELQAIGSYVDNGLTFVCSDYDTTFYNSRTVSNSGLSETEYIEPGYAPGQMIIAAWMPASVAGPGGLNQTYPGAPAGQAGFWLEILPKRVWTGVNAPNNYP